MIVMKSTEARADLLLTKELMQEHWNFLTSSERSLLYWQTLKNLRYNFEDYWPQPLDVTLMRIIKYSLVLLRLQFLNNTKYWD